MNTMKRTGLREQKELVEEIVNSDRTIPGRIVILRAWLTRYGYEDGGPCPHRLIVRETGRCDRCGFVPE